MKIFFDFEFIDNGKTINPISIGMVSEDDREYYAEFTWVDWDTASRWVLDNVYPKLKGLSYLKASTRIKYEVLDFCGENKPEFWGYYCSYDWVILCQLYGTMMDLPRGWPKWCRDVKQLMEANNTPKLIEPEDEHNALADARWIKEQYERCTMGRYIPRLNEV